MVQFTLIDWFRAVLILASGGVFLILIWRFIDKYKILSRPKRLLLSSMICLVLANGWRSAEAILDQDGFKGALIPFVIGLALAFAYLMIPHAEEDDQLSMDERRLLEENATLRAENSEMRDRLYELAVRNNSLTLQQYGQKGEES